MRHVATRLTGALAALAAGASLTLAAPAAAQAARGFLVINGTPYPVSSGCLAISSTTLSLKVTNYTGTTVRLYAAPGCAGASNVTIPPGDNRYGWGGSIGIG
jgi:hypothetical protein